MIQQSTPDNGNAVCLPLPVRSRWQPMRSGLLNLYRYDEQVFEYEHGHLLLRGNNGTGKSRVLALQLPFLLDGEVGAHRLEPDGDPAKRIEWNLLMGRYDTRLGYTWIELGRRDENGHGTGSGGEKAIALIIPQFAAAAAHYESAHEWAPRPILLDEAFVGVDADMRSKCMGLLAVFDLDFVMTSEREWGCYPTLPGVSIYHLSGRPGIDAVGVTQWVWNGRELQRRQESSVDSTQRIGSPRDTPLEASSGTSAGHRADLDDSDGDTGGVSRGNGDGETE